MRFHPGEDLRAHGVELIDDANVFVDRKIPLDRIARQGVTLHPGVRVLGASTVLDEGVELGREGPVVLRDCALGKGAKVSRGSAEGAVLLAGAALGPDAHVRAGTILEEEASTAHSVGLKQSILMPFATLGSQINFCDCLLAGGRSRQDHSEVGSGFIHFNFTPFGANGDKATASIFGDVPRGVGLRAPRIFLGGSGGVVGPVRTGFGVVLAAGSVYRRDYGDGLLVYSERLPERAASFDPLQVRGAGRKIDRSLDYAAELRALQAFYRHLRSSAATGLESAVIEQALPLLEDSVGERVRQVDRMIEGTRLEGVDRDRANRWSEDRRRLLEPAVSAPPASLLAAWSRAAGGHVERVRALDDESVESLRFWLESIVSSYVDRAD